VIPANQGRFGGGVCVEGPSTGELIQKKIKRSADAPAGSLDGGDEGRKRREVSGL